MKYIQDTYTSLSEMKELRRLWIMTYDALPKCDERVELFAEIRQLEMRIRSVEGKPRNKF